MRVVRPISLEDLDQVYDLSTKTGGGLTTLPPDKEVIKNRIEEG